MAKDQLCAAFLEPVDPDALGLTDYFKVVKNPMDLGQCKKMESSSYKSCGEIFEDIRLTFRNCCLYNAAGSKYGAQLVLPCSGLNGQFWRYLDQDGRLVHHILGCREEFEQWKTFLLTGVCIPKLLEDVVSFDKTRRDSKTMAEIEQRYFLFNFDMGRSNATGSLHPSKEYASYFSASVTGLMLVSTLKTLCKKQQQQNMFLYLNQEGH